MIDRAYLQVLADEIRPGWIIAGPGVSPSAATVTSVRHGLDGVDIAFRPYPRTAGNSQHVEVKPGDSFTRLADDDILDRIETTIVAAINVHTMLPIKQAGSTLLVDVDGVEWALPLRTHGARQTEPVDDDNPVN